MRGFGASLRNDLCATEGTFSHFFFIIWKDNFEGRQHWLMNHSSSWCTHHWNTVIRYLSSKSFSLWPLIPIMLISAAFSLCHIKFSFSLCIISLTLLSLFCFYSHTSARYLSLWPEFDALFLLVHYSCLFCPSPMLCYFKFFYSRLCLFFLTPSCSLIFTLCSFVIFFGLFLDFLIFTSQSFHHFPCLLLCQFRSKTVSVPFS